MADAIGSGLLAYTQRFIDRGTNPRDVGLTQLEQQPEMSSNELSIQPAPESVDGRRRRGAAECGPLPLEHLSSRPDRDLLEQGFLVTVVIVDERLADAGGVSDVLHAQLRSSHNDDSLGCAAEDSFGGVSPVGYGTRADVLRHWRILQQPRRAATLCRRQMLSWPASSQSGRTAPNIGASTLYPLAPSDSTSAVCASGSPWTR